LNIAENTDGQTDDMRA